MRALVAWRGGLFLTRRTDGEIGVLSVSSLFLTWVRVYWVYVCVYAHTRTHCRVLSCEPRRRDETPGGPEESTWTKSRHMCIRTCVQSTHV